MNFKECEIINIQISKPLIINKNRACDIRFEVVYNGENAKYYTTVERGENKEFEINHIIHPDYGKTKCPLCNVNGVLCEYLEKNINELKEVLFKNPSVRMELLFK
jgi:hypothetical protein